MGSHGVEEARRRASAALDRAIEAHERAVEFYIGMGHPEKADRERTRLEHARETRETWLKRLEEVGVPKQPPNE